MGLLYTPPLKMRKTSATYDHFLRDFINRGIVIQVSFGESKATKDLFDEGAVGGDKRFTAQARKLTGRSLGNNRFFEAVFGRCVWQGLTWSKTCAILIIAANGDSPVRQSSAGAIFARERLGWPHHARLKKGFVIMAGGGGKTSISHRNRRHLPPALA
ncbi:hypothetical protein N2601_30120 (plasmid) [Rhizobium sp. CB3060]|uniref:hypothetical protein n=1 Tax=Rhizobium sp. CB3060 TaxID=3138255 RepID=UPI0021A8159F|nr:hypothetical protein [Rhizobium tropici]UWU25692.1 hypothetical protein N2601_30120 [Rhizobium tropici]